MGVTRCLCRSLRSMQRARTSQQESRGSLCWLRLRDGRLVSVTRAATLRPANVILATLNHKRGCQCSSEFRALSVRGVPERRPTSLAGGAMTWPPRIIVAIGRAVLAPRPLSECMEIATESGGRSVLSVLFLFRSTRGETEIHSGSWVAWAKLVPDVRLRWYIYCM